MLKRQVVSVSNSGNNNDQSQEKLVVNHHNRVWIVYVLFHAGLLLPVYIFKVSNAVKIQLNLEVACLFAFWVIFGGWFGKQVLRWFAAGFGVFYVIAIIYKTYAGALSGLYQRDANFFNDFHLF